MKQILLLSVLFIVAICTTQSAKASHLSGGDLTYEHISGNTYRITFKMFRDCDGIGAPSYASVCIKNVCSNTYLPTASLPKIVGNIPGTSTPNGTPTSPGCPSFQTSCQNPASTVVGYEEWWYQGNVTLTAPPAAGCDQWRFSVSICCRNFAITNLANSSSTRFYVEAFLNRRPFSGQAAINNNSPTFTNAPIPYYCVNQPTTFNNGTLEVDGDSLTYTSIQPFNQSGCAHINPGVATYSNAAFNPTDPFNTGNTFSVNPANGQISFTPLGIQRPTIAIRISEYRNGVLIASVMREIQVVILPCNQPNPTFAIDTNTLSGGAQGNGAIDMCVGDTVSVCFNVQSSSSTALLTISDNSTITTPSASMTYTGIGTDSISGCYSWVPSLSDTGLNIVNIIATDSSCTPPGVLVTQGFTLALNVKGTPLSVTPVHPTCGLNNGTISATAQGATSYLLEPNNILNPTGNFTGLGGGNFTVTVQDTNICSIPQSVSLVPIPIMAWSNVTSVNPICAPPAVGSISTQVTAGTPPITYNLMPGNVSNTTGIYANLGAGNYTITATDASNCTLSTQVIIASPPALNWSAPVVTNVSCNGANDGSITQVAIGGTPALSYNLMPGNITNATGIFTGLGQGAYTITVTDANTCSLSTIVNITEPAVLNITNIASTTPSCVPGNDGSITVTATGGTTIYQYNIGGANQPSNVFNNLGSGIYTVTVTDANNCTATTSVNITAPNAPNITNNTSTNVSCFGGTNGTIGLTTTGGLAPLSYNLMPGNITNATGSYTSLAANAYAITVTDAIGCSVSTTINITEPTQVVWDSTSNTNVSCNGNNDGSIYVNASGGNGTINYNLTPGNLNNATGIYSNLGQGNYTITATDANNCSLSTNITITEPSALQWSAPVLVHVACNGDSTGSITQAATGGTPTLSYNLMPGNVTNTSGSFTNLPLGAYTITVTDGNNCTLSTTLNITEPTVLSITNIVSTTPSCVPGNDGSITVTATGGATAYQYNIGGANQASNIFNNIGGGVYAVTVTDANACTATTSVNILAPNAPAITNVVATNATCAPGADGTLTVTATGGASPYQYNAGGANQAGNVITSLATGSYIVTVTDAIGCSASTTSTIQDEPSPTINSIATTQATCNPGCDGSAIITASGGANPMYTYSITGVSFQNNSAFNNLCASGYLATVQDGNGCTDTMTFNITTANGPTLTTATADSVDCNGDNDGSITVVATGGTNPLSYNLTPGNVVNSNGIYSSLTAGNYTVSVTDANGCSLATNLVVAEPLPLTFDSVSGSGSSCSGSSNGTIFVSNVGGSGSIVHSITPSATYTPPGTFSNLVGNTNYTITATDANGCSLTTSVFVASPAAMAISNVTTTDVTCNGAADGTAQITTTGGTIPYSYNMQPNNVTNATGNFNSLSGASYIVTVSDANNCTVSTSVSIGEPALLQVNGITLQDVTCFADADGSVQVNVSGGVAPLAYNLQPTNITNGTGTFANLAGNNYTIVVSDANNCSLSTTAQVNEPNALVIDSIHAIHVLCAGGDNGQITTFASGGNGSNNYSLQPVNVTNTTGLFTTLTSQFYNVTVIDTNNCSATDSILITEPPALTLSYTGTNVTCNGYNDGTLTLTPNGGTPTYSYTLTPGNIVNNTGLFSNLGVGLYSVTVMDANNCTASVNALEITEPPLLQISETSTVDIECFGDNSGEITVAAIGGTNPLVYAISPAGGVQNNPGIFENLYAGNYTITITDANSCSLSTNLTLNQNPEMFFTRLEITTPLCHGDDNGYVELNAIGGVGAIQYSVDNGPVTPKSQYGNLTAGYYLFSAFDSLNCRIDTGINITQPDPLDIVSIDLEHLSCEDVEDGSALVTAIGGVGYHTFYVRPGIRFNRTGNFPELAKGFYTVTVIDTNRCEVDSFFTIRQNENPMVTDITRKDLDCRGYGDEGEAEVFVTGGEQPLDYLWESQEVQTTPKATGLRFGWHAVTVTDARGCAVRDSVYINPGECCTDLFLPNAFTPNGDGRNDEFRVLTTAGIELKQFEIYNRWGQRVWDTYNYNYSWNGKFGTEDAAPGTYYYVYRYTCTTDGKEYIKKGDIVLIR